jgi:molecular chaperone GrpE
MEIILTSDNETNSAKGEKTETVTDISNGSADSAVEKWKAEAEKNKNDLLYMRAEFDNYKRQAIKERSDLLKYGAERFVKDLLPILDNFERALETKVTSENFPSFVKGIELTAAEIKALLSKHSITEVPAEGQPFDPSIHEALSAEATDKYPPGYIARVFQKPYKFHDKVIRTGQVVVAQKLDA